MELLQINIAEFDYLGVSSLGFFWGLGVMRVMGDTSESRRSSTRMENLTLQNRIPRDLLQRFLGESTSRQSELKKEPNYDDDSGEIELNLGLSLGGRFGVDKSSNKLVRSSSIAEPIPLVRDEQEELKKATTAAYPALARTSSLPVETEEEWRKRKEMQSLRRMEAKRRRSEKQRVFKGDHKDEERRETEVNLSGRGQREQYIAAMNKVGSSAAPPFGLPSWAPAARQTILGGRIEALTERERGNYVIGDGGSRQGSIDSQGGGCSSSMSELESKPLQEHLSSCAMTGSGSCGNVSPVSIQSVDDQRNKDTVGSWGMKSGENAGRPSPSKKTNASGNRAKESRMNSMPSVVATGDGPNGRRIEGVLYKYGKGEEARIMCVCHGSFYSPAGFVEHAGGTDITNPLKHIVVSPNSLFS